MPYVRTDNAIILLKTARQGKCQAYIIFIYTSYIEPLPFTDQAVNLKLIKFY
jgi:hypothetical protein